MKIYYWLLVVISLGFAGCSTESATTPAPTYEIEPVPTMLPVIGRLVCVDCEIGRKDVTLWETPAERKSVAEVPHDSIVMVVAVDAHAGQIYYKVQAGDVSGWVHAPFLEK